MLELFCLWMCEENSSQPTTQHSRGTALEVLSDFIMNIAWRISINEALVLSFTPRNQPFDDKGVVAFHLVSFHHNQS